jgi:membrane peptidoglycan carboxypeptidase
MVFIMSRMERPKFRDQFIGFGFGEKTGIDLPAEIGGITGNLKSNREVEYANISFGQGIAVTPIGMIRAMSALANGGKIIEPRVVDSIEYQDGSRKEIPLKEVKQVIKPETSAEITRMMINVFDNYFNGAKKLEHYSIAGKTGTAQVVDPRTRQYSRSHYIASFAGFPVLADAKPLPVIYTWLDGPQGVYYASETAAPLFKEVLALVVNRFGIPATAPTQLAAEPPRKPVVSEPPPVLAEEKPMGPAPASGFEENGSSWRVPSLVGLTPREALRVMEGKPIEPRLTGFGLVRSQFPAAGSLINEGQTLSLQLGD